MTLTKQESKGIAVGGTLVAPLQLGAVKWNVSGIVTLKYQYNL